MFPAPSSFPRVWFLLQTIVQVIPGFSIRIILDLVLRIVFEQFPALKLLARGLFGSGSARLCDADIIAAVHSFVIIVGQRLLAQSVIGRAQKVINILIPRRQPQGGEEFLNGRMLFAHVKVTQSQFFMAIGCGARIGTFFGPIAGAGWRLDAGGG